MDVGWLVGWLVVDFDWLVVDFGWLVVDFGWLVVDFEWLVVDFGWLVVDFGWLVGWWRGGFLLQFQTVGLLGCRFAPLQFEDD